MPHAGLILAVALGGALGAVGRYLVAGQVAAWLGTGFPWGTLAVNVIGSFVLGALVETFALALSPSEPVRAMLVVGVLGAFTTFSTISLELVLMLERGELVRAVSYAGVSFALGVAALFAGLRLVRLALA